MLREVTSIRASLERSASAAEGWLDLKAPERALVEIAPLLAHPESRPAGLLLRVRAFVALERHAEALRDIEEIKRGQHDAAWLDFQEAWCRKRVADVAGAAACMERVIARDRRSALGHYNLACYLALLGETERSLHALTIACGLDAAFRKEMLAETDLDSLRGDARFAQLCAPGPGT